MTREEAIKDLQISVDLGLCPSKVSRKMAIKALEQESCEDCISRETARRIVDSGRTRQQMIDMILATPPVTSQPKTGHWCRKTKVDAYDIAGVKTWGIKCQCDRCDFTTIVVEDFGYYKYCPNCGCRMEGEIE